MLKAEWEKATPLDWIKDSALKTWKNCCMKNWPLAREHTDDPINVSKTVGTT